MVAVPYTNPMTVLVVSVLVGLLMILAGAGKLMQPAPNLTAFRQFGLAEWMVPVVGVSELIGGLLLLVPRSALLGAGVVTIVMAGASLTHLTSGVGSPVGAMIVLVLALFVGIHRWRHAKAVGRRAPANT